MTREICILSFPGFYESRLSALIDWDVELVEEHETEGQSVLSDDRYQREELRVDCADMLWQHVDYREAYRAVAEKWCGGLRKAFKEEAGLMLSLPFKAVTSPREYNFETDRLFVTLSECEIKGLCRIAKRDKYAALRRVLQDRCTPRSGFIPYYSTVLADWLEKPLAEWDHNELGCLLEAAWLAKGGLSVEELTDYATVYCEEFSGFIDDCTDWAAFAAAIEAERDKLRSQLATDDPDHAALSEPRCLSDL